MPGSRGTAAAFPEKGDWKLVASQIGVSPEALYREIAKRREHSRL
jgi:hypothetical protein